MKNELIKSFLDIETMLNKKNNWLINKILH